MTAPITATQVCGRVAAGPGTLEGGQSQLRRPFARTPGLGRRGAWSVSGGRPRGRGPCAGRRGERQECSQREDGQNSTSSVSPLVHNIHLNIYLEPIHFNEFSAKLNQLIKRRSRDRKRNTDAGRDASPGSRALRGRRPSPRQRRPLRRAREPRGEQMRGHTREE